MPEFGSTLAGLKTEHALPPDLDLTPDAVLAKMAKDGDPVPTGFAPLDARVRRGGIPPGRVVSIGGPPFVGKTTVVAGIALHVAQRLPVFALFSDEGRSQAAVRMAVMLGIPLEDIETDPGAAAPLLLERLGERSITLRKPESDFATAEDLFDFAQSRVGDEAALVLLDSIQTIPARRDMDAGSEREAYKAFMRLCRDRSPNRIVLLTSQSNRASYRSRKSDENSNAIASFSGTAAIEFLSDVALVMSLPDEASDIVKIEVVKNRLVSPSVRLPRAFHIQYSPETGTMLEVDEASREVADTNAKAARLKPTCDAVVKLLTGIAERSGADLERRLRGKGKGFGSTSVRAAIESLVSAQKVTELFRDGKGGGYFYALR